MTATTPQRRRIGLIAASLLLALIAASAPIETNADGQARTPDGTARFEYKVTDLSYVGKGFVSGSRESTGTCVAGATSTISGFATSSPADVPKVDLGGGDLTIGRQDTQGVIQAEDFYDFGLKGTYEQATSCEAGSIASVANTPCDSTVTAEVVVNGLIKGGVGDTVRITWTFGVDVRGGWFPDFVCVAGAMFEQKQCRTPPISLETLTRRKVRLPYRCDVKLKTTPPAGKGYDRYEAFSQISGVIKMKGKQLK